jgi:putative ABC transport system permease protein
MDWFKADLRMAARVLAKNPGFTLIAVSALALGIGANTAIFTVVNRVLLSPLPYPEADRIMALGRSFKNGGAGYSISIPKYMAWRENHVFESMTLYDFAGPGLNIGGGDRPEQVKGIHVSAGFFSVFGARPALGRTFTDDEDRPNGPRTAVVSFELWRTRYGGDPQFVGRMLDLNGEPYTVVGIMPPGFQSDPPAEIFIPLQADPNSANQGHYLRVAGRLKPGATIDAARAEMKVAGERFHRANPKWMDANESVAVTPLRDRMVGDVRPALLILFGAVGFVLLIACANVANLLLARAAGRQKEFAIRTAIGASRARIVAQLLTESVLLAGMGGVAGFVLGSWGVRALLALSPGNIPRLTEIAGATESIPLLDWRVFAFTIGIALLTGILFGLFPAIQISRSDVNSLLKETSGRSGTGLKQNRARGALVVTEIALALVLLVGAALMVRSFAGLKSVNPGFDPHNVLTLQTSLKGSRYSTTAGVTNLTRQAIQRIEGLPGVQAAATTFLLPLEGSMDLPFVIEGRPPTKDGPYHGDEQWVPATPHYFAAFRIPLLRGRLFQETDTANSTRVVIINEALAKKYWPKEDPIGRRMAIGGKALGPEFDEPPRQIVGVVGNVRNGGLDAADQPVMYAPPSQMTDALTRLGNNVIPLTWIVRTAIAPLSLRDAIQREIAAVDSQMPIAKVRSMEQVMSEATARQNFNMVLLSVFAGIALLLAAIGIYGLMSYAVEQRTHEFGIRMALGAARSDMLRMVVIHGMRMAAVGVVIGLAAAYGLTRLIESMLFGVHANDPLTFAVVAAILTGVALLASYVPARRATRVDPIIALRYE